jgi:hypothetical protein
VQLQQPIAQNNIEAFPIVILQFAITSFTQPRAQVGSCLAIRIGGGCGFGGGDGAFFHHSTFSCLQT